MNKDLGRIKYLLVLFIIILGFLMTSCSKFSKKNKTETLKVPVQVISPQYRHYQESLIFSGVTMPPIITVAAFQVPGKILNMYVKVGQTVKKGQLIANLDPQIYQEKVNTASANINLAEANLKRVYKGARIQQKEMARRQMLQSKDNYKLSQIEKNRFENLYKMDAIPKRQYDQVLNKYNLAKQQYKIAREKYALVKEGASKEEKQIARANVGVAVANTNLARTQLNYTTLFSPVEGVIIDKKAEIGAVVGAGTPIYQLQSNKSMDLVVFVPSIHIEKIYINQKAKVTFLEDEKNIVPGVVREIKPASSMPTQSYRVKIKLLKMPPLKAYSGNIGKAEFKLENKISGAVVPLACLKKNEKEQFYNIFIISKDNKAKKVKVKVLKIQDAMAFIEGDFLKDSKIVLSGQDYLKNGVTVRIVNALNSEKYVSPDKETKPKQLKTKL